MRELDKLKDGFNVRTWLDDSGINYSVSGDNVTKGWVNIACCYCYDHSNHLGIDLSKKRFHCWLCGEAGDIVKLIQGVEDLPFGAVKERLESFQDSSDEDSETADEEKAEKIYSSLLPRGTELLDPYSLDFPRVIQDYLDRRKFTGRIIRDFGLMWCGPGGEYPLRLVVPVWVGGRIVSWQAADVTGKASSKYISCPKDRAVISNKEAVYGIDDVADAPMVVIVEGVTDRWRVGKRRCVALFGKEWSTAQLLMIKKGIRKDAQVVVMLDPDAHEYGERLGWQLSGAMNGRVKVVLLTEGGPDPGAMTEGQLGEILRGALDER